MKSKNNGETNLSLLVFVGLLISGLAFFAGYMYSQNRALEVAAKNSVPTAQQPQEPQLDLSKVPEVSDKEYLRGSDKYQVVVIEYSDYECPYCKRFHATMQSALKEYGDKIAWVYRQYPLPFHPKAQTTAQAAECAGELGGSDAFWKLSDLMFDKMPDMQLTDLPSLAKQVGLDQTKFQGCLSSDRHDQKISSDTQSAADAGITGTPGSVIIGKNGKREFVNGALPIEQLKPVIDKVLN